MYTDVYMYMDVHGCVYLVVMYLIDILVPYIFFCTSCEDVGKPPKEAFLVITAEMLVACNS